MNTTRVLLITGASLVGVVAVLVRGGEVRAGESDERAGVVLSATEVREKISRTKFDAPGLERPLHAEDGSIAALAAVAAARNEGDSTDLARGMIVARIDANNDFSRFGLKSGANYLWIDRLGATDQPWRAVVVSEDGRVQKLLGPMKYTPDRAHGPSSTIADHAREYCGGARGCFYTRLSELGIKGDGKRRLLDTIWTACVQGCCEMDGEMDG